MGIIGSFYFFMNSKNIKIPLKTMNIPVIARSSFDFSILKAQNFELKKLTDDAGPQLFIVIKLNPS